MGVNYQLLFALLRAGACARHVRISTAELAASLEVSQQTSSRWLIRAQKEGWVERNSTGLKLTQKSTVEIKLLCENLQAAFESRKKLLIHGEVISGMKDGRYYVPLPEYDKQFKSKLGVAPYPGTLNVRIDDIEAKLILLDWKGITVEGFPHQGRFLGDIKCFPCVINKKLKGHIILPSRSHYGLDVLELISKANLRKALKLKDGDSVEITVSLE